MPTELTSSELAQLSAMLTGGGAKRSASADLAAKRFITLAQDRQIDPMPIIALPFAEAKAALEAEVVKHPAHTKAPAGDEAPTEAAAAMASTIVGKVSSRMKAKAEKAAAEPRGQSKREQAAALLQRPEGCTSKDILDATQWPAVSVPAVAKASKLALRQEKEGKVTRYWGTPIEVAS